MDRKAEGVHATSAEFVRYDQVDKKQRYHLAESAEDAYDESYEPSMVPTARFSNSTAIAIVLHAP